MRIFLAGASGVIGMRLVFLLVRSGHEVAGMTRTPKKAEGLRGLGAEPVICDVYDADRLAEAVVAYAPDLVMHQLTDLPDDESLVAGSTANARMRTEGTRNLLAATRAARAPRFFAQSVAWDPPGEGGHAKAEPEPGVAVSVTDVPATYASVQSVPHAMPAGADVTVPAVPVRATVSVYSGAKVAVTD